MTSFFDKDLFTSIPAEKEAHIYGDQTFHDMMYAKVLAVHLVNMLGYDGTY